MPDRTNTERQRRWRLRQAGELPPAVKVVCPCGKIHPGTHGLLCSRCWLKTDDGRAWQRQRMAAYRARQRLA
jgi:hypothetical protein